MNWNNETQKLVPIKGNWDKFGNDRHVEFIKKCIRISVEVCKPKWNSSLIVAHVNVLNSFIADSILFFLLQPNQI
jgi:hypothetical protein